MFRGKYKYRKRCKYALCVVVFMRVQSCRRSDRCRTLLVCTSVMLWCAVVDKHVCCDESAVE
jgi:hypothetical protein